MVNLSGLTFLQAVTKFHLDPEKLTRVSRSPMNVLPNGDLVYPRGVQVNEDTLRLDRMEDRWHVSRLRLDCPADAVLPDVTTKSQASSLAKQLRPLMKDFALEMFGSGALGAKASAKHASVASLTPDTALLALGIKNVARVEAQRGFVFSYNTPQRWDEFVDYFRSDDKRAVAAQVRQLFTGSDVAESALLIKPNASFGGDVYLIARLNDGSVAYLKDSIDVMP